MLGNKVYKVTFVRSQLKVICGIEAATKNGLLLFAVRHASDSQGI